MRCFGFGRHTWPASTVRVWVRIEVIGVMLWIGVEVKRVTSVFNSHTGVGGHPVGKHLHRVCATTDHSENYVTASCAVRYNSQFEHNYFAEL